LFDLLEPEDVVPAWKRWSPILLRPEGLYGTRPAEGGNKAAKLKAIREALRTAKRVWLATDCDREGQLIGQEILEHYEYRGQVSGCYSLRRTRKPSATHSVGQSQMSNMPGLRRRRCAPASAQPHSVAGTPLRIPYGNKEVALKLGARYRSGGWYAPPGVDLSTFGERGWL
jgi:hypothetical protein